MKRILVFGRDGQVARALARALPSGGFDAEFLDRMSADFADPVACADRVRSSGSVDAVVNAVAYTAVDAAESNVDEAYVTNAVTPGAIAAAATARGLPFVHLSTDYVFDGTRPGAYREDDPVNPLSIYGRSKLAGEWAVLAACPDATVIRTSWVYSEDGRNFVKTMLGVGCGIGFDGDEPRAPRDELRVVDDQTGGPTSAMDIARAILRVVENRLGGLDGAGVFHFQGTPAVTWYDFARAIFEDAHQWTGRSPTVRPIPTSDYPTPATRPMNSALDCTRIADRFGIAQSDWRQSLREVLGGLRGRVTLQTRAS